MKDVAPEEVDTWPHYNAAGYECNDTSGYDLDSSRNEHDAEQTGLHKQEQQEEQEEEEEEQQQQQEEEEEQEEETHSRSPKQRSVERPIRADATAASSSPGVSYPSGTGSATGAFPHNP